MKNKTSDFKIGRTYTVKQDPESENSAFRPGAAVVVIGKKRFPTAGWLLEIVSREGNHYAGLIQWVTPNQLKKPKSKKVK